MTAEKERKYKGKRKEKKKKRGGKRRRIITRRIRRSVIKFCG